MTTTANYGFYKPAEGEPSWGPPVNDNWDDIDTAIDGVADSVTTLSGTVTTLSGTVTALSGTVTTLDNTFQAHNHRTAQVIYMVDDFFGQNTASGDVGQLGWRTGGSGGSTTTDPGVSNHPGLTRISSGASTNRYANFGDSTNQAVIATQVDRFIAIVKPLSSVTTEIIRIGLFQDGNAPPGTDGVYFELNTGTSTNWNTVTRAASTSTSNASIAVTQNNWYQFEARRLVGGNWEMYINGTLRFTHSTNLPTVALIPGFYVEALAASTRELDIDFFSILSVTLGQRWT